MHMEEYMKIYKQNKFFVAGLTIAVLVKCFIIIMGYFIFIYNSGEFTKSLANAVDDMNINGISRSTVYITAIDGNKIEGWLYTNSYYESSKTIIMGPGLGSTKEDLLEAYAIEFALNEYNVILIDYRTFGGSEGYPRHWVDMGRHIEDYNSAIDFCKNELKQQYGITSEKIIIWGSSYSGGTSTYVAASNSHVDAVITQASYFDVTEEIKPKGLRLARYVFLVMVDMIRDELNLKPIYIPIYGQPGENAFTTGKEIPSIKNFTEVKGEVSPFFSLIPTPELHRGEWQNLMLVRYLEIVDTYNPISQVPNIDVPMLFISCSYDELTPTEFIYKSYQKSNNSLSEYHEIEAGHFDIYYGEKFNENIEIQLKFLEKLNSTTN